MKINNNENRDMCSLCRGKCCKTMGCSFSPEQVFSKVPATVAGLKTFLDEKIYAIDWYEGDPREDLKEYDDMEYKPLELVFYIRMGHKGVSSIIDPSWGGECKVLTPNGCPFSFEERPKGGQMLVPNFKNGKPNCTSSYTKAISAIEWIPYQELIKEVKNLYQNNL